MKGVSYGLKDLPKEMLLSQISNRKILKLYKIHNRGYFNETSIKTFKPFKRHK